ncbi:uncharacterized protein LOC105830088 [Monomorium pharaonis]|uniref:uncharacterized protein LOC105830088 n=1 Tax=Monomorium pharaonis TaxID=307658 RepID=UPI00063FC7BD|nr:uncharacterized protein LOC105830088 [Monomorium pharaonis]
MGPLCAGGGGFCRQQDPRGGAQGLFKTEAIWFDGSRQKGPAEPHITVEDIRIKPLVFPPARRPHGPSGLGQPWPAVARPGRTVALYGVPVWAKKIYASRALCEEQRRLAVRLIRGTVSQEAACVLSESVPWNLLAVEHLERYLWRLGLRVEGGTPTAQAVVRWNDQARRLTVATWKERLAFATAGLRAVRAIRPVLPERLDRRYGTLSYKMTQVLTGHGCYLHNKVGRESTTRCHYCGADENSAQHTLEIYPRGRTSAESSRVSSAPMISRCQASCGGCSTARKTGRPCPSARK